MLFPDPHLEPGYLSPLGFQTYFSQSFSAAIIPFWFLVLTTGSVTILCRLRWPLMRHDPIRSGDIPTHRLSEDPYPHIRATFANPGW